MGLIKAGIYIGAATYIMCVPLSSDQTFILIIYSNKITDEKKNRKSSPAQNTPYPPPQNCQDNRGYPPQYEQYAVPSQQHQHQKFAYYNTNAPYETQYQAPPPTQYVQEERGTMPARPYQSKIEDAPIPRQWPEAQAAKSSKWYLSVN